MAKNILITTFSADLLSIGLLEHLQQINPDNKIKILVFDKLTFDIKSTFPNAKVHKLASSDLFLLDNYLKDIHLVYHLGSYFSWQKNQAKSLYQRNLFLTKALVNACVKNGIEKLLFLSSLTRLQSTNIYAQQTITEQIDEIHPEANSYAKSHYLAEIEIHRAMAVGISSIIVYASTILSQEDIEANSKLIQSMHKANNKNYGIAGFIAMHDLILIMQLLMDSKKSNESFILNAETLPINDFLEQAVSSSPKMSWTKMNLTRYQKEQQLQPHSLWTLLNYFSHQKRTIDDKKIRSCFPKFQYKLVKDIVG